ncbi:GNAT family N-acetyltransferase [Mariniflexile sp.]|uniref:GNAT family N-acetyltransferase n=1 Tax=Mariniflexile sp. TaxID=1979402 RepID=UPI004047B1BE
MNYIIKETSALETYPVRHPVLRTGKSVEACAFDGDDLETTCHLGIYIDGKLVGVSSFLKSKHPLLHEEFQYQLRGMAVLNAYQSLGLGKLILNHGENLLKKQNVQIVWCHARQKAANFYKKNGYEIIGLPFDIKDIGLHYIMYKTL